MTCRDIIEFLADYAAGTVTAEERTIFEAHLAICPPCVAYLRTYQATVQLGKTALSETQKSDPIPEELVAAIVAARKNVAEDA
jgi:anti-sigma factor RsiW